MTPVNIIVIYVKKNTIQSIGSTIVQIPIILYIPNIFLEITQIWSLEVHMNFPFTHTPLLSLRKLKTTLNVTFVVILAQSRFINVPSVISTDIIIVYIKDKCSFNFYLYIFLLGWALGVGTLVNCRWHDQFRAMGGVWGVSYLFGKMSYKPQVLIQLHKIQVA